MAGKKNEKSTRAPKVKSPKVEANLFSGNDVPGNDAPLLPLEKGKGVEATSATTKRKPKKKPEPLPAKKKTNANPKYTAKKELAKLLYTQNDLTIATIAQRVEVTEKTLSGWIKDNNWESFKKSLVTTKNEQLMFFYDQLHSLNNLIKERPEGARFADSKEADVFVKLSATIKNLETETGIGQIFEVAKLFLDSIPASDRDFIIQATNHFDHLIKAKLAKK